MGNLKPFQLNSTFGENLRQRQSLRNVTKCWGSWLRNRQDLSNWRLRHFACILSAAVVGIAGCSEVTHEWRGGWQEARAPRPQQWLRSDSHGEEGKYGRVAMEATKIETSFGAVTWGPSHAVQFPAHPNRYMTEDQSMAQGLTPVCSCKHCPRAGVWFRFLRSCRPRWRKPQAGFLPVARPLRAS